MKERLIAAFSNLLATIAATTPKVLVGLLLIVGGILVAKIVERLLRAVLVRVRFDSLVAKVGIDRALQRIGLRQQLDVFVPRLVYFLLLFLLAKTAADALGLVAVSDALGAFFAYLPNIIAALLLLILGSTAAQFVGNMVTEAAQNSGIDFAPSLGRLVSALVLFIVGVMAFSQLKFDTEMVRIVTSFLLGGAALAFGLSIGLGSRDIVRNFLAGFYVRRFLQLGKSLEIGGQRGILRAVTATHTILEQDTQAISLSNATFLDQVSKQG
jgi:small-conductance mechanosensitive channel